MYDENEYKMESGFHDYENEDYNQKNILEFAVSQYLGAITHRKDASYDTLVEFINTLGQAKIYYGVTSLGNTKGKEISMSLTRKANDKHIIYS